MTIDLPTLAPCSWSEESLLLRYPIPKISTQKSCRPFGIYWSDKLSYGRLWPVPSTEELSSFYNLPSYNAYMSNINHPTIAPSSLASRAVVKLAWLNDGSVWDPVPSIFRSASIEKPEVCDIGCGGGKFLLRMRDNGAKPVGIDPSPASALTMKELDIEFYTGTAEDLPPEVKDRRFDIVTLFQSLEHCHDPATALLNATNLLKRDGLLVVDVPNLDSPAFRKYRQAWWHTDAGRHLHFFTKRSLETLLRQVGAAPIRWEFSGFSAQFSPDYIRDMAKVWDNMFIGSAGISPPPRPSLLHSAGYLPLALFSRAAKKYDIVRAYCRRHSLNS